MLKKICYLLTGIFFGFALSRSGASHYDYIYLMFAGKNLKLAFLMGTAIVVGGLGMVLLKKLGNKDVHGNEIKISSKPFGAFTIVGGILFGMGWALSGACPGTVLAQLGEGKVLGLFTFLGMLFGTYLYARLVEKSSNLS